MRRYKPSALFCATLLAIVAVAPSGPARAAAPTPPYPSMQQILASAKAWLNLNEKDKESALKSMIAAYRTGWGAGYLTRTTRDSPGESGQSVDRYWSLLPTEMDRDEPKFPRSLSDYAAELTTYFRVSPHMSLEGAVGCLPDNLSKAESAICGSFFQLARHSK
jgi:hypothetical protein